MTAEDRDQGPLDRNILDTGEAIYAAGMILTYCLQRGIELEDRIIEALIEARRGLGEGHPLSAEAELRFWQAFNASMRKIAPVTIESLAASLGTFDYGTEGAAAGHRPIPAVRAVRRYRGFAILLLLILVLVQGYADWGLRASSRLKQHVDAYAALEDQVLELENQVGPALGRKQGRIVARRARVETEIWTHFAKLQAWAARSDRTRESSPLTSRRVADVQLTASLVLSLLQSYLLPLLYGLVGASLQVLRTLRSQLATYTYAPASELGFRVNLALGALAGIAIGWLLAPEGVSLSDTSVSRLALSFVAGYSVELVFKVMDTFIARAGRDREPPRSEQ